VSYYGRTPAVTEALSQLYRQTAYNFGFWFGEIIIGLIVPIILFLVPRFNRNPKFLVLGALCAVAGVIFNRWDITVTGLYVPVSFSPGTSFQLESGIYWPGLVEWGVAIGIVGYALLMLTLGIKYLPLFGDPKPRNPAGEGD
jgi:molybdopterin-containing oxidoreductase family membrane subunit